MNDAPMDEKEGSRTRKEALQLVKTTFQPQWHDEDHGYEVGFNSRTTKSKHNMSIWWNVGIILLCDLFAFIFTFLLLLCRGCIRRRRLVKAGNRRCVQRIRKKTGKRTGWTIFLTILYIQGSCPVSGMELLSSMTPMEPMMEEGSRTGGVWSLGNAEEATRVPDTPLARLHLQLEDEFSLMAMGSQASPESGRGLETTPALVDMDGVAEDPMAEVEDDEMEQCSESEVMEEPSSEREDDQPPDDLSSQHGGNDPDLSDGGPYSVSEGIFEEDWKHFYQFRRHHVQRHCYLRWSTHHNLIRNIANTWEVSRSAILQVIHITSVVQGVPDIARNAIVVIRDDDPSADCRKFALVDVVWHTLPLFIEGPQIFRRVLRLREAMTRDSLLLAAEVRGYCINQRDRCLVKLNGATIAQQDRQIYPIRSGDYIVIDVPPLEDCWSELSLLQIRVVRQVSFRSKSHEDQGFFPSERSSKMRSGLFAATGIGRFPLCLDGDLDCRSGWTYSSFEDLSPPGNPTPQWFEIGSDDADSDHGQIEEIDIGSASEDEGVKTDPIQIQISPPDTLHQTLRLLQRWPPNQLKIDFDPACNLIPVSLQYLSLCGIGMSRDVRALYIYTDGSYNRSSQYSAFAFAVFGWCPEVSGGRHRFIGWFSHQTITQNDHDHYTGASQHSVEEAEASGILWAMIWLLQSGINLDSFICFDSMTIGYGASGQWNVRTEWAQGNRMREVAQLITTLRRSSKLSFEHTKAHSRQPCNEIVDALAYHRVQTQEPTAAYALPSWQPVFDPNNACLSWAWWYFRSQFDAAYPQMVDGNYAWTLRDWRGASGIDSLEKQSDFVEEGHMQFRLQVATFNVMTLKPKHKGQDDSVSIGAAQFLRQQLHEAGHHIIGLQETRANQQCTFQSSNYYRFVSGDLQGGGHRGVELWVSRQLPFKFNKDRLQPQCFDAKDITVISAADDLMAATIRCAGHYLVVFVCHAPYEGADYDRKQDWWTRFDTLLTRLRRKGKVILLGDFNSRLGQQVEDIIGDRVSFDHNDNGDRLTTLLQEHSLWLPSTFSSQQCTDDATWTHPRGHKARLDYIALDQLAWWQVEWSGVDQTIQVPHTAMDHSLVGMRLTWHEEKHQPRTSRPSYDWEAMATNEGRDLLQKMLSDIPSLSWGCEVHHQWEYLESCIHHGLQQCFPPKKKFTRSDIFSSTTWHFRNQKSVFKSGLEDVDSEFQYIWMKGAFRAWRYGACLDEAWKVDILQLGTMHLARLHILVAFRQSAKALREQVAIDKAEFVNSIVDRAATTSTAEVFKALRPLRIGGRFRKMKQPPLPQLQTADGEMAEDPGTADSIWLRHCANLEAGVQTTTNRLLQRIRKGSFGRAARFQQRELVQAPTLLELERSFRRIKRAKAPGHDGLKSDLCNLAPVQMSQLFFPILAKMVFQMEEPLQSKGGVMIAAFKGGRHDHIDNFRGLLLSSHAGKAVRRTIRQQLQAHYSRTAPQLHISIRAGGSVSQASHALRAYQSIAKQRCWSAGTLFLDVKSAYYRVVRQLAATLSNSDEDICRLLRYFELSPDHLDALLEELRQQSECSASDVPPHLECLLAEMLSGTWFMTETKQHICESLAGSRPGDGLADIVFGFIFKRVMGKVVEQATSMFDWSSVDIADQFDLTLPPPEGLGVPPFIDVVWADDLAFSAMHEDAEELINIMTTCTALIFKQVLNHGMIPNLKAGKTELLLSLRGKKSRAAKQRIFNVIEPTIYIAEAPEGFQMVRLTAKYRHLGTQVHLAESLMVEIKARLGQSSLIYRKHRKQVFQNRKLPLQRRILLFNTMVLSVLQYNLGTWYGLSSAEFKFLRSRLYSMYRGLCRAEIREEELRFWNEDRVLNYLQLPDVQTLLHGARLRYGLSLGRSAPQTLWHLLAVEKKWLAALRSSQAWFSQQVQGFGPLRDGSPLVFDLNHSLRHGGRQFGNWIKKAIRHSTLQRVLLSSWKEWHHRFLVLCSQFGLQLTFPWTLEGVQRRDPTGEVCLLCQQYFDTKAAWSVHAFKRHQRVNPCRFLLGGSTRCEACMKEFRTTRRLFYHFMHQRTCARKLRRQGLRYELGPGRNSTAEDKDTSAFPIPALTCQGPQRNWSAWIADAEAADAEAGEEPDVDEELMESLADFVETLDGNEHVEDQIERCKQILCQSSAPYSQAAVTLHYFFDTVEKNYEHMGLQISQVKLDLFLRILRYRMRMTWFIDPEQLDQPWTQTELQDNAWDYCRAATTMPVWKAKPYIPRFISRCLVFVHFFSGVRREGDLQQYLEEMDIPDSCYRVVLSLDIVFDARRADLTVTAVQEQWITFIKRGCICGIYAGPPCESWSRARKGGGLAGHTAGDGGPRVIRTREHPYGLPALRLREIHQAIIANILLLFTLEVFCLMTALHKVMVLEHPAEPDSAGEDWMASIWRLAATRIMESHPMVRLLTVLQGKFGGASPKPTQLLVVAGDVDVDSIMQEFATTSLPPALVMGRKDHEFATASLKEYPALLCKALATISERWCRKYVAVPDIGGQVAMQEFLEFTASLRQSLNESALRGPDFAL